MVQKTPRHQANSFDDLQDFIPHVEATLMATDTAGLEVLQNARCFDCYATWHEAKMKGELHFQIVTTHA